MARASAPGKVIIGGEHAVVYENHRALAGAISARSFAEAVAIDAPRVEIESSVGLQDRINLDDLHELTERFHAAREAKDADAMRALHKQDRSGLAHVKVIAGTVIRDSGQDNGYVIRVGKSLVAGRKYGREVPLGAHMGSSSSIFSAIAGALTQEVGMFSHDYAARLARYGDMVVVGTPSGIDSTVTTYGGAILFTKGPSPETSTIERLQNVRCSLAIANTGVESSTGEVVARVREKVRKESKMMGSLDEIDAIVRLEVEALKKRNMKELGRLMNSNHEILRDGVGISIQRIDEACAIALEQGAYGAKGTGAYAGGCVIALAPNPAKARVVVDEWKKRGFTDSWVSWWGSSPGVSIG